MRIYTFAEPHYDDDNTLGVIIHVAYALTGNLPVGGTC